MPLKSSTAAGRGATLHPTAQKLLDTTIELLETHAIEEVALAQVLEKSGVSHGSLYHHFEDFPDLVEQAVVERYTKGLNDAIEAIAQLLECDTAAEFRRRTEGIILYFNDQDRRPFRLARLEALGALRGRPRLAQRITTAQQRVTVEQAGYYAEFQRRGWFRSDLDPLALSTFTTSVLFGRVVDDVIDDPVEPNRLNDVVMRALQTVLFGD